MDMDMSLLLQVLVIVDSHLLKFSALAALRDLSRLKLGSLLLEDASGFKNKTAEKSVPPVLLIDPLSGTELVGRPSAQLRGEEKISAGSWRESRPCGQVAPSLSPIYAL